MGPAAPLSSGISGRVLLGLSSAPKPKGMGMRPSVSAPALTQILCEPGNLTHGNGERFVDGLSESIGNLGLRSEEEAGAGGGGGGGGGGGSSSVVYGDFQPTEEPSKRTVATLGESGYEIAPGRRVRSLSVSSDDW